METKLTLISQIAKGDKKEKVNNLMYLMSMEHLKESYFLLKRGKASGVDGVDVETYGTALSENLRLLTEKLKAGHYIPKPVRRTYIPKANGKMRPLGIPTVEDKVVQHCLTRILTAIYEPEFLEFSYGFRPGRSCHSALKHLDQIIMTRPVRYIIDADIKGFFDNVSHEWMLKFLRHRISEEKTVRLIARFLKSGYLEEGVFFDTVTGTPQGGIISPMLANIYLHYVLDLWFEKRMKRMCKGFVEMVRYADDFVICTEHEEDAKLLHDCLKTRLEEFCLSLAEDKTRVIRFGRDEYQKHKSTGSKCASFNFLGFTHYQGKSRKGNFLLGRKTDSKKMRNSIDAIGQWLSTVSKHAPVKEWWKPLKAKISGHMHYYGVSGNTRELKRFLHLVTAKVHKTLNRRSQRGYYSWEKLMKMIERFPLGEIKVYHNFYVNFKYSG